MAYVVTAKWTAKPGSEEVVLDALRHMIEPSRAEPGCRFYQPTRDLDDPHVFLIYEIYDDEPAYEAHAASEHAQKWGFGTAIPLLASRERTFGETLDPVSGATAAVLPARGRG
jgi:quinol monooxygenase YgiN